VIIIRNFHPRYKIPVNLKEIKSLISKVFKGEKRKIRTAYLNFVTNNQILAINKKYLKHNYYTDIITFDYSFPGDTKIDGEMLISLDRIRVNAGIFKTNFKDETKRVIIHGCLHLAGYNDRTKAEKELIRFKENSYLRN
jgi:probable rRNA maturation factor